MSIDQTKLLSLLNEVFNQQAKIRKGVEAVYFCPFCHHYKPKLEVNLNVQKWHCWTCNTSGMSFRSLFKKLNVARSYFTRLYDITKDKRLNIEAPDDIKKEHKQLPDTFIPLADGFWGGTYASPHRKSAMSYLRKRNVTDEDILRYNIGYAEAGEYQNRIIIPSYDKDGNLNFFSSRAFYEAMTMSHKLPDWSKDVIGFELFINWAEDITLVEGSFDALAIRKNAIPLFGKTHLIKLEEKDPSILGFGRISEIIQDSKPSDFHNIISMKLFE